MTTQSEEEQGCDHSQYQPVEHRDVVEGIVLMVTCGGCGVLLQGY